MALISVGIRLPPRTSDRHDAARIDSPLTTSFRLMSASTRLLSLPFLLALAPVAAGQELKIHTRTGDPAPGGGLVQRATAGLVDDAGNVLRLLDTSRVDLNLDQELTLGDQVLLNEGVPLPFATDYVLDTFHDVTWTGGDLGAILGLDTATLQDRRALVRGDLLLEVVGEPLMASGAGAGTTLLRLDTVTAKAGTLLAIGVIDDPTRSVTPASTEDAILRYRFDASSNLLAAEVVVEAGDVLPVLGGPVGSIDEHGPALNSRGDFLCRVRPLGGPSSNLMNLAFELAREGELSPLRDRRYVSLGLGRLALNDHRDYAFGARVDGEPATSSLIVVNGAKFVQSGDVLPDFSASPLARPIEASPLQLSDNGELFWWATSESGEAAFMRNRRPIVKVGQSIAGLTVTSLQLGDTSFSISPEGRYWIGNVVLDGSVQALLAADLGLATRFGGCRANDANLSIVDGLALPGETLQLTMSRAQATGVVPVLRLATRRLGPCDVMTGAGEALLDPTSVFAVLTGPAFTGAPAAFSIPLPNDPSLVDQEFFAQGAFADVGDQSPAANLRLTNGLRIVVGAP